MERIGTDFDPVGPDDRVNGLFDAHLPEEVGLLEAPVWALTDEAGQVHEPL